MVTAVSPSSLVARLIEAYQRFISPYKGFCCAHRAVHGRDSCSQFAKRVAVKRGLLALFPLLRRRFTECGVAARVLDYESREARRRRKTEHAKKKQKSSCDFDPCSGMDCTPVPEACDAVGGVANAVATPADCAGGADCGGADCVGCDVL
jgi:putative component of membrane protein insertase Oxa1/YidC/SpoIIIJ protein YidD